MLRPRGKDGEGHTHAADDDHGEKNCLPERLHRGDGVGKHGDDEARAEEGEGDDDEGGEELCGMHGQGHAVHEGGEGDLQDGGGEHDEEACGHGGDNERAGGGGEEAETAPDAAFAFGDHGGGHAEAAATEDADGENLSEVGDEGRVFAAEDAGEGDEEEEGDEVAVNEGLAVFEVEEEGEFEMLEEAASGGLLFGERGAGEFEEDVFEGGVVDLEVEEVVVLGVEEVHEGLDGLGDGAGGEFPAGGMLGGRGDGGERGDLWGVQRGRWRW